jgi:hypothetical protein
VLGIADNAVRGTLLSEILAAPPRTGAARKRIAETTPDLQLLLHAAVSAFNQPERAVMRAAHIRNGSKLTKVMASPILKVRHPQPHGSIFLAQKN